MARVRVGMLLRLSKKKGKRAVENEPDIPTQRDGIARFIESRDGWTVVKEYKEDGVSAYSLGRAQRDVLQDIMNDAEAGEYDALVVWKGDRLSRRIQDFPGIVADLDSAGVEVWSVVDAPGGKRWSAKTAIDLLMLSVEGFKNQSESESISIRSRAKKRQLATEGRWQGGRAPYGYILITKKRPDGEPVYESGRPVRELVPDPDTAPILQEIFQRYAAGQGGMNLAGWLNSSGIPSSCGTEWTANGVRYMLQNPLYAGQVVHGRSHRGRKAVGTPIQAQGSHEALISMDLWTQVTSLRSMRKDLHPMQHQATYALTGVLRCGVCGSPMAGAKWNYVTKEGRRSTYGYRCLRWIQSKGCSSAWYRDSEVEEAFIAALQEQFTAPTGLRIFLEEQARVGQANVNAELEAKKRANKRLRQVDDALKRVDRAYFEAGTLSDADYTQKREEYQTERRQLEEALARPAAPGDVKDVGALVEAVKDIRRNWPYMTPEERKAWALNFITGAKLKVLIHPDKTVTILPQ